MVHTKLEYSRIMIADNVSALEALKTPWEVAEERDMDAIIPLLNEHVKFKASQDQEAQTKSVQQQEQPLTNQAEQQEWKDDTIPDAGEVHETPSNKCKEAIGKVIGKSESEVRQMMRRGEVPANMWSEQWSRFGEAQKKLPMLQEEETDINEELIKVTEQIVKLQQKKKDLEQRLRDVQQALSSTMVSPEVLHAVETLARAEQNERKRLKVQLKDEKENTMLSIADIGFFLNAAGISGSIQKLTSLAEQNQVTEMSLGDTYFYFCENMEIESRLEVQFAIDMLRLDQYPPYDKHRKECPVCSKSVAELLAEYQILLKESEVAKISSSGLMYLEQANIGQLSGSNTNTERLQSMNAIKKMRQNHINFIWS